MASGPFAYQYMQAQGQGLGGGAFGGEPSYTNGMPDTLDRQNYGQPGPSFLGGHPSGGVGGMQYGMKPPMGNEYVPGDAVEGGGHGAEGSNDNRLGAADEDGEGNGKRRRVQRACDVCRRKKIRCDGLQPGKSACTNCASYGLECTFVDAAKKRAPPRSYVDALENRMERMEKLLASLAPGVDFSDKIGKPIRRPDDNRGPDDSATAQQTLSLPGSPNKEPGLGLEHGSVFSEQCMANKDLCPSAAGGAGRGEGVVGTDDEEEVAFLENSFGRTSLWDDGRLEAEKGSDLARALQEVVPEAVAAYSSQESEQSSATPAQGTEGLARNSKSFVGKASGFHLITQLERLSAARADEQREFVLQGIRPQYWAFPSGFEELPPRLELIDLCWPVPELEQSLVDAYFARVHSEYPVVNEVVFRDELKNHPELRKSHDWLGVAMGIFAIGSRFIDDPRVLLPSKDPLRHTAGLPYWNVKKKLGIRIFTTSSLHQLQSMVLGVVFLLGTPLAATSAWSILGATVRLLQDAGAHRQVTAKRTQLDVVEKETRKRLFWICYSIDRELSAGLGRPMCIQDEDFDLDEPLQVDDEHICEARESGKLPVQPADKPSRFSGFVIALRLSQINGRTLRTIYAIGKAKVTRGFIGPQWDQFIVAEIDSALNQWLDTVPDHLRYNPHETNDEWLIQSSLLHTKYYQSQILVHRPFIPGPKAGSPLNFPSLAICTNAARSISHVVDNLLKRNLHALAGTDVVFRAFGAGCVLLMVVWGAKRSGARTSTSAMADVRKCLDVLFAMEKQWQLAGKLADVLSVLVRVSELPVPVEAPEPSGIKRPLEADDSTEGSPVRPDGSHANAELPGEGGTTSGRPGGASATRSRSRRQGRRSANTSSASLRVPGQPLPLHTTELVSAFQGSAASSDTHDSPAAATEGMSNEHDVYSPPGGMTPAAASALHSWHDAQMQQMQEAMKQQTQQQQQHQRQQCQQGPNAEVQAPFGQFFAPVTSTMQPSAAFFAGNSNGLGVGLGGVSAGLGGMFGAPLGAPGQQNVMQSRNFAQGLQPQQGQGQQQQQQGFDESFFSDAAVLTPSASNMGGGGRNGNSSMPRAPNGNGTGEAGLDGGQGRMGGNGVDGPDAFNALWSSQHLWELDDLVPNLQSSSYFPMQG